MAVTLDAPGDDVPRLESALRDGLTVAGFNPPADWSGLAPWVVGELGALRADLDEARREAERIRGEVGKIADQMRWTADVWEPVEDPRRRFLRAFERDIRALVAPPAEVRRAPDEGREAS